MLKVAIVGLGGMGKGRLRYYAQIPEARVVAVADVRHEALRTDPDLRRSLGGDGDDVTWFADAEALAAWGGVDMADICLPTHLHAQAAIALLHAGIHVLCEKPMARTIAACDAMIAAAQQADRRLMIAQCVRFWPEYVYLADLLRCGEAGRLLSLQLSRQGPIPRGGAGWMCQRERSGGVLLDLHIHDIDYCQYLLGLPQRVYAQGGGSDGEALSYDYVHSSLDYGAGRQVSVLAQWVSAPIPFRACYEAHFEAAYLRFDSGQRPPLTVYRPHAEPEYPELPPPQTAYADEIRYFVHCLLRDEPLLRCPPQESRQAVALAARIANSLARCRMIDTSDLEGSRA